MTWYIIRRKHSDHYFGSDPVTSADQEKRSSNSSEPPIHKETKLFELNKLYTMYYIYIHKIMDMKNKI